MPFVLMLFALAVPARVVAQGVPQRPTPVEIRETRTIPRDVADDMASVFNGAGARRVSGDVVIGEGEIVSGDLAILEGTLTIAGRVTGRVAGINADVLLRPSARLERDLLIVGGQLEAGGGEVTGDIRIYRDRVEIERLSDRIVVRDAPGDPEVLNGQVPRRSRWRGELRFVSARTYNRVEGLPVLLGPTSGRTFRWGRITVDALGIYRSADSFAWNSDNLGHSARVEVRVGHGRGVRVGGRLFDVVEPVEGWQLTDTEVGIASFFLHRDFRDYFDRHGASLYAGAFVGPTLDVSLEYSDERWGVRDTRDPWTLFRDTQTWRVNPPMDAGRFHTLVAGLRVDTRNDPRDPWTGWYFTSEYEYGRGRVAAFGPTSPGIRQEVPGAHLTYGRVFADIRRYNRVSPSRQFNWRVVAGGWVHGDELPLQRRFSLGGPGTLPGYDFRRLQPGTDYLTCSGINVPGDPPPYPPGVPAQCDRMVLAQLEYRGEINIDPFGFLRGERRHRRFGWGQRAEWVVFADAGRGWLVGPRSGELHYPKGAIPPFGTFRADIGLGLRLDDLGIYVAKSLSDRDAPANFIIRLKPRF